MRVYTSKLTPESVVTYLFHMTVNAATAVIVLPSVAHAYKVVCDDNIHLNRRSAVFVHSTVTYHICQSQP